MTIKIAQEKIKELYTNIDEARIEGSETIKISENINLFLNALAIADSALNYLQVGQCLSKELELK